MTVINIEVVFDFVCAWCYVAERTLEQAIQLYQKTYPAAKSDTINIAWQPYYLDYNPSVQSIDKKGIVIPRLAGMTEAQKSVAEKRVNMAGRAAGLDLKWGGKIGSSRKPHRLMYLARSQPMEVQNTLRWKLFEAHNELEMDISTPEVLQTIAVECGLNSTQVREFIQSDAAVAEVDEEARLNKEKVAGSGVPTIFINSRMLPGQPDVSDLLESLIQAKEEAEAEMQV